MGKANISVKPAGFLEQIDDSSLGDQDEQETGTDKYFILWKQESEWFCIHFFQTVRDCFLEIDHDTV